MVTLFWFTKHNKEKMLVLVHRYMNVLYVWLVSSKYLYRLQSYGKSPITSGSPLIVYRSSRRPCVRPSVRAFTLSNMNISATSWPIQMKFYQKHHWGGGKAWVGFDLDRIRTLVSMATDSSHRVIMGKTASSRFLECFSSDPFHTCR